MDSAHKNARAPLCKVLEVYWCFIVAIIILSSAAVHGQNALSVVFTETPSSNFTSSANATFSFNVVGGNDTNPCDAQQCSFRCQLDQSSLQDCVNRRASFSNLQDGDHVFSVAVNTSSGTFVESEFRWTVDTVAPTAVVDGGPAFTDGQNVTVNITFSEFCGFVCTNASFCDLWVHGAGVVIPSTLKEIEKGLKYSLGVALSTAVPSGKINVVIARSSCADVAGNRLQRSNLSSSVIRFDRTVPSVNLWTAVPSSQVIIANQPRTCEATNNASDLKVYLDFDMPVKNSAEELLRLLSVSNGILTPTGRKSSGNRRFGFALSNVTNVSEVTIALAGNAVSNRYGTFVPSNSSTTFLYDIERPQVQVTSTSRAKTKESLLLFVVQFTETVFGFNSSGIAISGGSLRSFKEIDKSTYTLEVAAVDDELVTVTVTENRSLDIAGNFNLASSAAQVRHYTTPAISVVLYSLITVGLLSTVVVSGVLSVSSATLEAAGAVSDQKIANPSTNLLRLACHLQVVALSGWLATSLPIEYQEVTNGLRWLIPHVATPWQARGVTDTWTSNLTNAPTMLQNVIGGRRRLLEVEGTFSLQHKLHRGRELGANATLHGPALGPGDYELNFLHQTNQGALESVVDNKYNGWHEFQRTMFWLGVVGGGLILLHILMVLFLRWRTRAPIKGALIIPRFELYLLILVIPGLCQASAFNIRNGSPISIAIGSLLLVVPVAFLLSVLVFLIYGVFLGKLVQYKEFRYEVQRHGYVQPQKPHGLVNLVAGTGFPGNWVRNSRLAPTFLPRYGLIFEDYKGPPTILVHKKAQNIRNSIKRIGSTKENGDSDEESNDVVEVSDSHRILGDARAAYILMDLCRRIALGLVFGIYLPSDYSWSQVGIVLVVTTVQLVYLVVVKPFRRRGVQVVETIALLCELGIFITAMVLLARRHPTDLDYGVGIFMLVLLVFSFVAQLVTEWYALLEQLMRLSTAPEPSLKDGFKKLGGGLILPFTPRRSWGRFIGPQAPQTNPAVAVFQRKDSQQVGSQERAYQDKPLAHSKLPLALPNPVDTRSVAQTTAIDVDSGPQSSEEIQVEPSPRSERHLSRTPWGSILPVDGRRSRGGSSRETESQELKILRELAKASFPGRHSKDGDTDIEQGVGLHGNLMQISSPIVVSPREVDENRYARKRRQLHCMQPHPLSRASITTNVESISVATSDGDIFLQAEPLSVPEIADLVVPPSLSTNSTRDININKGPGQTCGRHFLNLRDSSCAVRPPEER